MEPGLIAASERRALDAVHARYAPVNDRVAAILENIRCDCRQLASETRNRGNERQVEEFIARLSAEVGNRAYEVSRRAGREPVGPEDARRWDSACRRSDAPCVVIERQRLSALAVRTTRWNYLFTVPGESEDRVDLVAHYDTWRGPGADDNTTGEEILKQYLLADLRAARRPALTHTYFMAGSEEWAFDSAFDLSPRFAIWVASHTTVTLVAVVVTELAILLYLMTRRIPTWMDNGYRHENRADNLGSLKRVRP